MTATRLTIAVVFLVGALTLAPVASAIHAGGFVETLGASGETEEHTEANATAMGTEVSAFMQASATDTDESVDARMFTAAYDRGDNATRQRLIDERTTHLESRLAALEAEYDDVTERRAELNDAAYTARLTSLAIRIDALERAVDDAEPRAAAVGADTEALATLRSNASSLSGPEVAAIATRLGGVDRPGGPPGHGTNATAERGPPNATGLALGQQGSDQRGPPAGVGGGPDGEHTPGSGTANASNASGPPGLAGAGEGPPGLAGAGDDNETANASHDGPPGHDGDHGAGPPERGAVGQGPVNVVNASDDGL
ncbi:hypothetical protein [Natronobiforma cellulositropha]|uniref:hypothetical protein n=1 Tax=Natronobiforma cellulositropha TaxID=1679076 RepID=UPI0021D59EC5|nr:hypothetical protein [Natronobiforma cellulositropha]